MTLTADDDARFRPASEWWAELPASIRDAILFDPEGPLCAQAILAVTRARGRLERLGAEGPAAAMFALTCEDAGWIMESGADEV